MKIVIDTAGKKLTYRQNDQEREIALYSNEAFELLSQLWLKVGWNQKYVYTFSWMGRPIIQLPEDLVRVQEVIYRLKPDVIIETGIAHGGSLIFYAGLCKAIGKGRVIGIDIDIRPANRKAIEDHELFSYITLIEGDSVSPKIVEKVKSFVQTGETVLVLLDSNHSRKHVLAELDAYHPLVTRGSYIVATDGIMKNLSDTPRGKTEWSQDNPADAAADFLRTHPEFFLEQPAWPFHESDLKGNITHWPGAWLKRI